MIEEYEKLPKSDDRYLVGQTLKAKIIRGLISRIICLTYFRKGTEKTNGKKDADLKVHFRLGKEMSAKEWMALGGVSAEAMEGAGSVSEFLIGALGNCNVGADVSAFIPPSAIRILKF
jgi:hypothetical protein